MSLPCIVLTPFAGAYNLLGVGYCSGPVEALSECVSDQGSRGGVVTADPTVDIAQQALPLLNGDAALQDPGVASFVEFAFYKNKGLDAMHEPSSFRLVCWQRVVEEVVDVERSLVIQRVGLCCWTFFKLHDLGVGRGHRLVSLRGRTRRAIVVLFRPFVAYRGFVLIAGEHTRWHRLSTRRGFCKCVGLLVEAPWDVIEFEAIEFVL